MHWEGNSLFYGKIDTSIKYLPHEEYPDQYYLIWDFEGPKRSVGFFNISNTKDNARILYMRYHNNTAERGSREPRGDV